MEITNKEDQINIEETENEHISILRNIFSDERRNIILTGKAGTGKSWTINLIKEIFKKIRYVNDKDIDPEDLNRYFESIIDKNIGNNRDLLNFITKELKFSTHNITFNDEYIILAPTGKSALVIGGKTYHSFFKFYPKNGGGLDILKFKGKSSLIDDKLFFSIAIINTFIIDEVSMISDISMDVIIDLITYVKDKTKILATYIIDHFREHILNYISFVRKNRYDLSSIHKIVKNIMEKNDITKENDKNFKIKEKLITNFVSKITGKISMYIKDGRKNMYIKRKFNNHVIKYIDPIFILVGDNLQLSPIKFNKKKDEKLTLLTEGISNLESYNKINCGQSFIFSKIFENKDNIQYIELTNSYRQNNQEFIDFLSKIRNKDGDDLSFYEFKNFLKNNDMISSVSINDIRENFNKFKNSIAFFYKNSDVKSWNNEIYNNYEPKDLTFIIPSNIKIHITTEEHKYRNVPNIKNIDVKGYKERLFALYMTIYKEMYGYDTDILPDIKIKINKFKDSCRFMGHHKVEKDKFKYQVNICLSKIDKETDNREINKITVCNNCLEIFKYLTSDKEYIEVEDILSFECDCKDKYTKIYDIDPDEKDIDDLFDVYYNDDMNYKNIYGHKCEITLRYTHSKNDEKKISFLENIFNNDITKIKFDSFESMKDGKRYHIYIENMKIPTSKVLKLHKRSQIMTTRNSKDSYSNGSIGEFCKANLGSDSFKASSIRAKFLGKYDESNIFNHVSSSYSCPDSKNIEIDIFGSFPIVPAYSLTINKAQGMTLKDVDVYFNVCDKFTNQESTLYFHPYVAFSRVKESSQLKIIIEEDNLYKLYRLIMSKSNKDVKNKLNFYFNREEYENTYLNFINNKNEHDDEFKEDIKKLITKLKIKK